MGCADITAGAWLAWQQHRDRQCSERETCPTAGKARSPACGAGRICSEIKVHIITREKPAWLWSCVVACARLPMSCDIPHPAHKRTRTPRCMRMQANPNAGPHLAATHTPPSCLASVQATRSAAWPAPRPSPTLRGHTSAVQIVTNPAPAPNARAPAAQACATRPRTPHAASPARPGRARARQARHRTLPPRMRPIRVDWVVVRCFIEATLEHSQAPGAYVQACALLPPPSPLFQRKYRAHRHCPRSIPGAKPANNLPEQGLTLLTQPKL